MARRSIRRQLTQRLLIGMIAFSALSTGALYLYLRQELYEEYNAALVTEARAISSVLCSELTDAQLAEMIKRSFPRMHLGPEEHGFLEVWNGRGHVVMRSTSLSGGDIPQLQRAGAHDDPIVEDVILPDGGGGRATSLEFDRLPADANAPATTSLAGQKYIMTLAVRRDELNDTLGHLVASLVFIGAGLTASAVALVIYGVRRELRPLRDFSDQVSQVDANTLAYRFADDQIAAELQPVRERLNDLLARLAESFNRERRFSANLAHELRTPIAELRSMIEVAIKWPSDPASVAHLHGQIFEVSVRMSRLVDAMFSLVRVEHGANMARTDSHSLHEIVSAAWKHASISPARRADGALEVDEHLSVVGDRTMLEGLIGNLLANAAQHGVPGTQITCTAVAPAGGVGTRLMVSNVTRDLQPSDLAQLEEPFWRKDTARTQSERLGLGLSLVRDYAKAMGIELSFRLPEATTFVVELRWPAADEPFSAADSLRDQAGS